MITQLSIHKKSLDEAKKPRLKIHDLVLCNRRCDSFTPFYGRGKKLQFYAINRDTGRMLLRLFSQLKMQHRAKKVQLKKCAMTEEKNELFVLLRQREYCTRGSLTRNSLVADKNKRRTQQHATPEGDSIDSVRFELFKWRLYCPPQLLLSRITHKKVP